MSDSPSPATEVYLNAEFMFNHRTNWGPFKCAVRPYVHDSAQIFDLFVPS
jgi:hypothetical protein